MPRASVITNPFISIEDTVSYIEIDLLYDIVAI